MTFQQYCKIERSAGGVTCSNRKFIKACLDYILPQARHHHLYRKDRHQFIRDGLAYKNRSLNIYRMVANDT
jgi:hypothetical protein